MLGMQRVAAFAVMSVSLLTLCSGCGSGAPPVNLKLPAVEVTLKQKGKPLAHVEVTLVKPGSDDAVGLVGQAGPNGVVSVEGVPAGEYEVRVVRNLANGPDPAFAAYGSGTPLKAVVTETERKFSFDL